MSKHVVTWIKMCLYRCGLAHVCVSLCVHVCRFTKHKSNAAAEGGGDVARTPTQVYSSAHQTGVQ